MSKHGALVEKRQKLPLSSVSVKRPYQLKVEMLMDSARSFMPNISFKPFASLTGTAQKRAAPYLSRYAS